MASLKELLPRAAERIIKGSLIGLVIILPGISGGTMLLATGLYEDLMRDLSRFKLTPWLPFAVGMAIGIFLSGWLIAWLFETYTSIILAFLLGCILASVKFVLDKDYLPNQTRVISLVIGLLTGLVLADAAGFVTANTVPPSALILLLGGALSSAAMIIPGVPGNYVLIIMGIYNDIMSALAGLDWITLGIFAAGCFLGIIGLSNALSKIYARHRDILNWLFVGLIIGSSKMLIPAGLENPLTFVLVAVIGFLLVWKWESI